MTKAQKTKEELRQMILQEGKASPGWPAGMDVSVRATAGGWRVDCRPPSASRLAFADSCQRVASITLRLREDFDLIE